MAVLYLELLCCADSELSPYQEQILTKNHINIIHKAKLSPIYIIETENIETVKDTGLFANVELSPKLSLADVTLFPHISNKPLKKKVKAVGWGIKVAVIDSGVMPDIIKVCYSKDFTPYGNQIINNHGTHVAKIIEYFAPGAQIMSFKVAHQGKDITAGSLIAALDDAMNQKADIINMSLGSVRNCKGACTLCNYVDLVKDEGFTVVAAAGNSGKKLGNTIECPGAAEKAITVGSVNGQNKLDQGSGKGVPGFNKPNLLAPGYVKVTMRYKEGVKIEPNSGTSFAAPVVTGILASMFSRYSEREYLITKVYETCKSLSLPKHYEGFGLINLPKLTEVVMNDEKISNSTKRQGSN